MCLELTGGDAVNFVLIREMIGYREKRISL